MAEAKGIGSYTDMGHRLIVLGNSGFVGNNIYNYFSDSAYKTVGFSSNECNLLSMDSVQNRLSFVTPNDTIIMTSAITRLKENSFESMMKNMLMADNLSKFIEKNRIGCLVFLSTVDVYGLVDSITPISEKLLPNPNDYYALSKLASEFILKKACKKNNIPLLILRLSGIYGSGDEGKSTINKLVESAVIYKEVYIYGDGWDKRDFVYVEDVCNVIKKGIDLKVSAVLNIATGNSYSINEIVEIIKSCVEEEFSTEYRNKGRLTDERVKDMVYDVSLLSKMLPDIRFTDIREGVRKYLYEYKKVLNTKAID